MLVNWMVRTLLNPAAHRTGQELTLAKCRRSPRKRSSSATARATSLVRFKTSAKSSIRSCQVPQARTRTKNLSRLKLNQNSWIHQTIRYISIHSQTIWKSTADTMRALKTLTSSPDGTKGTTELFKNLQKDWSLWKRAQWILYSTLNIKLTNFKMQISRSSWWRTVRWARWGNRSKAPSSNPIRKPFQRKMRRREASRALMWLVFPFKSAKGRSSHGVRMSRLRSTLLISKNQARWWFQTLWARKESQIWQHLKWSQSQAQRRMWSSLFELTWEWIHLQEPRSRWQASQLYTRTNGGRSH